MGNDTLQLNDFYKTFENNNQFNLLLKSFEINYNNFSVKLKPNKEYKIFEPYLYKLFNETNLNKISLLPYKEAYIKGYEQGLKEFKSTYIIENRELHKSVELKLDEWKSIIFLKRININKELAYKIGLNSGFFDSYLNFKRLYPTKIDKTYNTKPIFLNIKPLNLVEFHKHIDSNLNYILKKTIIEDCWYINLINNEVNEKYKIFEFTLFCLLTTQYFANDGIEYYLDSFRLGYKKGEELFQEYIDKNKITDLNIKYKVWKKDVKDKPFILNLEGIEKIGKLSGCLSGFIDHMKSYPKDLIKMLIDEPFQIENLEIIFALFIENEQEKMELLKSYQNLVSDENGKKKVKMIIERLSILKKSISSHPKFLKDGKQISNYRYYHQFINDFYKHIPEDNCVQLIKNKILYLKQKCNEIDNAIKLIHDKNSQEAKQLKSELYDSNLYLEYLEIVAEDLSTFIIHDHENLPNEIVKTIKPHFTNSEDTIAILKDWFETNFHSKLEELIKYNISPTEKLVFLGNGNKLLNCFKLLFEYKFINGIEKKELQIWIQNNFYFMNKGIKSFTDDALKKGISRNDYDCKNPIMKIENGLIKKTTEPDKKNIKNINKI